MKTRRKQQPPGRGDPSPATPSDPAPHPTAEAVDAAIRPDPAATGQPDGGVTEADRLRGRINAGSVRMVVRHHLPQIQACYDRALKRGFAIKGTVEILLVLAADGTVRSTEVFRNTTGHQGLGKCIAFTMGRWKFPRPLGGVETKVIYPFAFGSTQNKGSR